MPESFPEWQHLFVARKPFKAPGYGGSCLIEVMAGLLYLKGNRRPYFSVTAAIGTARQLQTGDWQAGGCCHSEIAEAWPELAPVIALHLSDDIGLPMHAEANGWYSLAGYYGGAGEQYHRGHDTPPDKCLQVFADHVRLPLADAKALADGWRDDTDWPKTRRMYQAWLAEQTERYQTEVATAIRILDTLR